MSLVPNKTDFDFLTLSTAVTLKTTTRMNSKIRVHSDYDVTADPLSKAQWMRDMFEEEEEDFGEFYQIPR